MPEKSSTKKVSLTLVGSSGKMGQMLRELILEDPELELAEDGDVVVDFSTPEGTLRAIEMERPLVCGTTGLSDEILKKMQELSQRAPVLYSPNFSLGVSLLFEMLEEMGPKLKKFSTASIEETHHKEKVDAPSGTAKKLAALLKTDAICSKREGEVVGIHTLKFLFDDERLTIQHEATSRKAFARGALFAAKFLVKKNPGFYPLSAVFN